MKKLILILAIGLFSLTAFSQRRVYDKGKTRQLHSMVFRKWEKSYFRPKWYYWLFHNSYRSSKDKRLVLQNAVTIATSLNEKARAEEQGEDVNTQFKRSLVKLADHQFNPKYNLLFKESYNSLISLMETHDIDSKIAYLKKGNVDIIISKANQKKINKPFPRVTSQRQQLPQDLLDVDLLPIDNGDNGLDDDDPDNNLGDLDIRDYIDDLRDDKDFDDTLDDPFDDHIDLGDINNDDIFNGDWGDIGVSFFAHSEHKVVIASFKERHDVIEDTFRPSAEKNEAYTELETAMRNYVGIVRKVDKKLNAMVKVKRYNQILKNKL